LVPPSGGARLAVALVEEVVVDPGAVDSLEEP